MNFRSIDWADSNIERIEIEYDCAKLIVFNDALQKQLIVKFNGFIGLTNLLFWDDQIIDHAEVHEIQDNNSTPFIQKLFAIYDKDFNYGERWLNKGILEVQIHLVNHTFLACIANLSTSHLTNLLFSNRELAPPKMTLHPLTTKGGAFVLKLGFCDYSCVTNSSISFLFLVRSLSSALG